MFSGPFNRIIDAVANIAQKLGATVNSTGNRLADNLDGIANVVTPGGGGGSDSGVTTVTLVIDETTGVGTMNKTWQEISDALTSLHIVFLVNDNNGSGIYCGYVTYATRVIGGAYGVEVILQSYQDDPGTFVSQPITFNVTSPDGYPTHDFSN